MLVEIINTGSELMLGRVLNTHHQWLGQQLAQIGHTVVRQTSVADTAAGIQSAVREALTRADLVITTGGLGPTSDDLTRDLIAEMLGKKLQPNTAIAEHIKSYFIARKRPMPESVLVQALVPEGTMVLANANGTAPGLAIKISSEDFKKAGTNLPGPSNLPHSHQWLIMLPGPPRELRPMFVESVAPLLRREFAAELFICRTLRSFGIGESAAEEKIKPALQSLAGEGLELGYCARPGQVDIRLAARGPSAKRIVDEAETIVRRLLGDLIFGLDDDTLEIVLVRLLKERQQTLAVAESCTGGGLANRITNVPGASAVFLGGFITYSNAMKQKFLGVSAETLAAHGAVSESVAREMAEGARHRTGADFVLAITGIAGPDGGSAEKPVGTVFIALAAEKDTKIFPMFNATDRETFKELTAQQALNSLRLLLIK